MIVESIKKFLDDELAKYDNLEDMKKGIAEKDGINSKEKINLFDFGEYSWQCSKFQKLKSVY